MTDICEKVKLYQAKPEELDWITGYLAKLQIEKKGKPHWITKHDGCYACKDYQYMTTYLDLCYEGAE